MKLFDHEINSHVGDNFLVHTHEGHVLMVCTQCNVDHRILESCNPQIPGNVEISHLDWHDAVACGIIERTRYKSVDEYSD